jgi:hypothetical protein
MLHFCFYLSSLHCVHTAERVFSCQLRVYSFQSATPFQGYQLVLRLVHSNLTPHKLEVTLDDDSVIKVLLV